MNTKPYFLAAFFLTAIMTSVVFGDITITNIAFDDSNGVDSDITSGSLGILTDGLTTNNAGGVGGGFSVLIEPAEDAMMDLGHEFTLTFDQPHNIASLDLFSDFRILDAGISNVDITYTLGGTTVASFTNLAVAEHALGDPGNPAWLDPGTPIALATPVNNVDGAILTVNAVHSLTGPNMDEGYQIREISFSSVAVPEPSSAVVLGLCGLALLRRRRRAIRV